MTDDDRQNQLRRMNDAAEEMCEMLLGAGGTISEQVCARRGLTDFESNLATVNAYMRVFATATAVYYELDREHFFKRLSDLIKDEFRKAPRTS
jgi:hypothetical protein